jgi:hypothetical protein
MVLGATLMLAGLTPQQALAQCRFLLDSCDGESEPAPRPAPQTVPQPPPQPAPQVEMPAPEPPRQRKSTYWNHNGSVMLLKVQGSLREFYYAQPRPGMVVEGVQPGTLLFTGNVHGNSINGTAWFFSRRCGPRSYQVRGAVQENGGMVTMSGMAFTIGKDCSLRKAINDTLVFTYLYSQ